MGNKIGFGLYSMSGVYGEVNEENMKEVLKCALNMGVKYFDVSQNYGRGEEFLGEVVPKDDSHVEIWTKLSHLEEGFDLSYENILSSCRNSLKKLNRDHIDLYTIHYDDTSRSVDEIIAAVEKLKSEGLIREYGLGHTSLKRAHEFCERGTPFSIMTEINPGAFDNYKKFEKVVQGKGIRLISTGSTARGLFTDSTKTLSDFHKSDIRFIDPLRRGERYSSVLRILDEIKSMAKKYDASTVQVVLKWISELNGVHAVLTGPRNKDHITENFQSQKLNINREDIFSLNDFISKENENLKVKLRVEVEGILQGKIREDQSTFKQAVYALEYMMDNEKLSEQQGIEIYTNFKIAEKNGDINRILEQLNYMKQVF